MKIRLFVVLSIVCLFACFGRPVSGQEAAGTSPYLVQPGDTWQTLAWRFGINEADLRTANPHPNRQRMPVIGSELVIPTNTYPVNFGELIRSDQGGLLQSAVSTGENPWRMAITNNISDPYSPLFNRPLFVASPDLIPRDLPKGFTSLILSTIPAKPGQATALQGMITPESSIRADYGGIPLILIQEGSVILGLFGTGAFFPDGDHDLTIWVDNEPMWSQPWRMVPGIWTFEEITLTGTAAAIDQETIARERERLQIIWSEASGPPLWNGPFQLPLKQFIQYSSNYGARRSYNGGPYRSYHEGLDFSAYGGTSVLAPASGKVVLAEFLDVRGGAVIIDHGLGVHSGYYHLSEVLAVPGQLVETNDEIGRVGSTGLSTGNHLHWDFLVGTTWVDPASWINSSLGCWLLSGRESNCE